MSGQTVLGGVGEGCTQRKLPSQKQRNMKLHGTCNKQQPMRGSRYAGEREGWNRQILGDHVMLHMMCCWVCVFKRTVAFSTFMMLFKQHHYLAAECFHHPKGNPISISNLFPLSSLCQPLAIPRLFSVDLPILNISKGVSSRAVIYSDLH